MMGNTEKIKDNLEPRNTRKTQIYSFSFSVYFLYSGPTIRVA